MEARALVACALAFVLGLLVMSHVQGGPPPRADRSGGEKLLTQQIGDVIVVQDEYGHHVYSKSGELKRHEFSPAGLKLEMEAVGATPQVIKTEKGELLHLLDSEYSHDKGVHVTHQFYELREGKLVRVPVVESGK
jgi:hypothetical protein